MRQLGRWWLKNRSPALLATSPINTRLCRIRFRLELLGAVRISCHGGNPTAVGKYKYPVLVSGDPTRASAAAFFVIINAINLTNVKVFGEMEFCSLLK